MSSPIRAAEYFAGESYIQESAPGRINLLGEHTDYNDGFMLPTATPQRTVVSVAVQHGRKHRFYSAALGSDAVFPVDEAAPAGFARYVAGCIGVLEQRGVRVPPLRIHIDSNVPLGQGCRAVRRWKWRPCAHCGACLTSAWTTGSWPCWRSRPRSSTPA